MTRDEMIVFPTIVERRNLKNEDLGIEDEDNYQLTSIEIQKSRFRDMFFCIVPYMDEDEGKEVSKIIFVNGDQYQLEMSKDEFYNKLEKENV